MERPAINEEALLRAVRRYFRPSDGAYDQLNSALTGDDPNWEGSPFEEAIYAVLCIGDVVRQKESEVRELLAAYNRGEYD